MTTTTLHLTERLRTTARELRARRRTHLAKLTDLVRRGEARAAQGLPSYDAAMVAESQGVSEEGEELERAFAAFGEDIAYAVEAQAAERAARRALAKARTRGSITMAQTAAVAATED